MAKNNKPNSPLEDPKKNGKPIVPGFKKHKTFSDKQAEELSAAIKKILKDPTQEDKKPTRKKT